MNKKFWKFSIRFIIINIVLYLLVAFVLILWPGPDIDNTENYNYSTIIESSSDEIYAKEIWIKLRDGKELFSRIYPSETSNYLILIHGSGSDSRYLSKASKYFSDSDLFNVITPDLRGHGRNSGDRGDIKYIGQLEDDIEDIVEYTKDEFHANIIILGGHSSGGGLVLRYIGNGNVTKVDGAIMYSPYLGYKSPTLRPDNGNWVVVSVKHWVGLSLLNNVGINSFNGRPVLFFSRPSIWNDSLQVASYSYRMALSMDPTDYKNDINNIHVPTIVFVGSEDESFYPNKFKEIFSSSKYTDTHVVEGAAHLDVVDNSETLQIISDWVPLLKTRMGN